MSNKSHHGATNPNWRGGKTEHPLYHTYNDMVRRCSSPNHARFADYGGRGITVCDRWREDFWNFVADMGERPAGRSLDRTDNDRGYSPENCRWATAQEQRANRRRQRPKAECKSGHEFTPENTSMTTDGKRRCKTCVNQWARDARARRAA